MIMASAAASLRAVRAAYDDDPEVASKMPKAWDHFLREMAVFYEEYHRSVIDRE